MTRQRKYGVYESMVVAACLLMFSLGATAQQSYVLKHSMDSLIDSSNRPQPANPFTLPGSDDRGNASAADALGVQFEHARFITSATFAFDAPSEFYTPRRDGVLTGYWNSSLTGSLARSITPSETTYVRFTGDFERFGQRREPSEVVSAGGQTMTFEWELAHLVGSRLGALEFSAGPYRQRSISPPVTSGGGPISDVLLGYSGYESGWETAINLPERNLSLTFRCGNETLGSTRERKRLKLFELSWSW